MLEPTAFAGFPACRVAVIAVRDGRARLKGTGFFVLQYMNRALHNHSPT